MSLIAPPPLLTHTRDRQQPAAGSPPSFELPAIAFFGRSFGEYCRMFDLDPAELRQRPVLDVAAGPSAFTAEACRLGIDAVAVAPLYGSEPAELTRRVEADLQKMITRMRGQPGCFRFRSFPSFAAAERDRRAAAQRFLEDYRNQAGHGRYFGAALPQLPFLDSTFDLVLCAHLLFIYSRQFDYAFHLAACRELMRVARDEVRIHPVCGPDGRPFSDLERLTSDLATVGIEARVVMVDYEFFVGSDSTLILTHRASK